MERIQFVPIGVIHTPFKELEGMPIQPTGARGVRGIVEVFVEYQRGLKDLEGFSHIILIYFFHQSKGFDLEVIPFLDTEPRGLFATRAPKRPNPIGISVVELERIQEGLVYVKNVDILDGTPLLDIKPYVPDFDSPKEVRVGWLEKCKNRASHTRSNGRFVY